MLSRVADSLYWMSRYFERANHCARVLEANHNLMLNPSKLSTAERWQRITESLGIEPTAEGIDPHGAMIKLTSDAGYESSIAFCIAVSRENAGQVREQISSEMWEHLNMLFHRTNRVRIEDVWHMQTTHGFFRDVKEGAQLFQGLTDSTMSHNECWQFLQLGRYIERANYNSHFLDVQFGVLKESQYYPEIAKDFMEWVGLLKCFTAFEAYCKVHTADLRPEKVVEFLLLNQEFPHSIRFAVDSMEKALMAIDEATETKRAGLPNRLIGKLKSDLSYSHIDEIMETGLSDYLDGIQKQSGRIHNAIYDVYISYPIEKALV